MNGLMQSHPLLISNLLVHAEHHHGEQQIVSRRVEGDIHRYTYKDLAARSRQVAKALAALGIKPGHTVGTLAWNGYRHMELYYGVSGSGAVLHTLNPRLHPDQVVYIADHAEDQVLCFDLTFLPLVEAVVSRVATIRHFVLMTDRAHMPVSTKVPNLLCYDELLDAQDDHYDWPQFDENSASSLCYTSGTTGNPKGVLYSHRSTLLHSWTACAADGLALSARDSVLLVVPLFHVNAWGVPYAGAMCGAKLVLPGPALDGAKGSIIDPARAARIARRRSSSWRPIRSAAPMTTTLSALSACRRHPPPQRLSSAMSCRFSIDQASAKPNAEAVCAHARARVATSRQTPAGSSVASSR